MLSTVAFQECRRAEKECKRRFLSVARNTWLPSVGGVGIAGIDSRCTPGHAQSDRMGSDCDDIEAHRAAGLGSWISSVNEETCCRAAKWAGESQARNVGAGVGPAHAQAAALCALSGLRCADVECWRRLRLRHAASRFGRSGCCADAQARQASPACCLPHGILISYALCPSATKDVNGLSWLCCCAATACVRNLPQLLYRDSRRVAAGRLECSMQSWLRMHLGIMICSC